MDLDALARRQLGVVSRAQVLQSGMSAATLRHRLDSGRWVLAHPGVYRTATGEPGWRSRASAALLHVGATSALCLDAAAAVWGFSTQPDDIDVALPHARRVRSVPGVVVHRRARVEARTVSGLRVTSAGQTVIDLADRVPCSADEAIALVADVCRQGRTSASLLAAELAARSRHRQRAVLLAVLQEVGAGAEALSEVHVLRRVLRPHRLPPFTCQHRPGDGSRRGFVCEAFAMVLEVDGQAYHAGARFHLDRRRDRRAAARGEIVLRAGWVDVQERPCHLAADLAAALRHRGWSGRLVGCSATCAANDDGEDR